MTPISSSAVFLTPSEGVCEPVSAPLPTIPSTMIDSRHSRAPRFMVELLFVGIRPSGGSLCSASRVVSRVSKRWPEHRPHPRELSIGRWRVLSSFSLTSPEGDDVQDGGGPRGFVLLRARDVPDAGAV